MNEPTCSCGAIVDPNRDKFCWHSDCHRYICSFCYNAMGHADHRKFNEELNAKARVHDLATEAMGLV